MKSWNTNVAKGGKSIMDISKIINTYPIGTKVKLTDDGIDVVHEVYGYELFADCTNIVFKDGIKLNMKRIELIAEVVSIPKGHGARGIHPKKVLHLKRGEICA